MEKEKSKRRKFYPNFGKDISENHFKMFISATLCFYVDIRDRYWDEILSCDQSFNEKSQQLTNSILLIIEKHMPGWCSKH